MNRLDREADVQLLADGSIKASLKENSSARLPRMSAGAFTGCRSLSTNR